MAAYCNSSPDSRVTIRQAVTSGFESDFFNVFNPQGLNQPGAFGFSSLQTSAKGARQIQLTLRLFW